MDRTAIESKVGRTSLTDVLVDLLTCDVFSRSDKTGKAGPTETLEEYVKTNGDRLAQRAMTIEWGSYEIYDPGVSGPPGTLSRADSRFAFDKLMREKSQRLEMRTELLELNGLQLDRTDAGVQCLDDWFRAHVEEDPERPGRLLADWYSVVDDIALFLGEVMIERHPHLRWELFTPDASTPRTSTS